MINAVFHILHVKIRVRVQDKRSGKREIRCCTILCSQNVFFFSSTLTWISSQLNFFLILIFCVFTAWYEEKRVSDSDIFQVGDKPVCLLLLGQALLRQARKIHKKSELERYVRYCTSYCAITITVDAL